MTTPLNCQGIAPTKLKQPKFFFVFAKDMSNLVENADDEKEETVLDRLGCPPGDGVLRALRRAFARTYFSEDPLKPRKDAVEDIKKVAMDALQPLEDILRKLKLTPVAPEDKQSGVVQVFKFVIIPSKEIQRKVKDEKTGRKVALMEIVPNAPADAPIQALRQILKLTFSEVYTDADYQNVLADIRLMSARALLPVNWMLEEIEVEPVAIPKVLGNEIHADADESELPKT